MTSQPTLALLFVHKKRSRVMTRKPSTDDDNSYYSYLICVLVLQFICTHRLHLPPFQRQVAYYLPPGANLSISIYATNVPRTFYSEVYLGGPWHLELLPLNQIAEVNPSGKGLDWTTSWPCVDRGVFC